MTSLSENDQKNEVSNDNGQSSLLSTDNVKLIIQQSTHDDQNQEEIDTKRQSDDSTSVTDETNAVDGISNDDNLINTSPPIVTTDDEQQQKEATEITVNPDEDASQSKKSSNSKVKYSSMPYHRSPYYTNGHPYGPPSYYYYSLPTVEKPAPLMFVSTQQSSSSPSSRDNQTGNLTTVSPQNLPPRLRQISTTETDSNSQPTALTTSQISPSSTTTNIRRHRSILPRGANNYYSPHPPPPLMATPPGVLYPYPPAVHQPGHIAYNIRTPDELELLAFQQQLMSFSPNQMLWPPPPHAAVSGQGHPHFLPYAMNGLPSTYVFDNSAMTQQSNSFLNPEAAEWVPLHNDNDALSPSPSENHILIDDEINFPPLNSTSTYVKDHTEDNSEQTETSTEIISINDNIVSDNSPVLIDNSNISTQSNLKIESKNVSSSSQNDTNKSVPSIPNKTTPITYSTIISQSTENNKPTKNTNNQSRQQQLSTNHVHNQLPPRDRTTKQQQGTQMMSSSSSNSNSRRRQPFNNNRNNTRNLLPAEPNLLPKQPVETTDDWIEVKSKKTKKFDRNSNENSSEKFVLDEQVHKSVSPPLSLTSTGDNTTATFTSEDDFDEKDTNQDLVILMETDVSNGHDQIIIDDIHNRLDNDERLLIIMRGCPGSGKSTLANTLNHGYNGLILSTDDYFTDNILNKYIFDLNKLDDAHRYNRRRASDALKRNISPIIIDNTNTQAWEMRPYVAMGYETGYDILLVEPQTPWRYKARELFKRNRHNLPLRRIREMLNRFEHDITVQNIIDQLPPTIKTNTFLPSEPEIFDKDNEIVDPILTSKKFYDIIDDSLIVDDVRLCINDMILFLTSNFYQTSLLSSTLTLPTTTATTSQPSTPLSVSFHDLSLIPSSTTSSLPPTPSTPHSRFHRPLTRFPSTTNQDHSYSTEHILRLPTTALSRCIDAVTVTPPLSTQSNNITKKRRKNKNKQQSDELFLNTNNNNNNMNNDEENVLEHAQPFSVILPEDCMDFVVVDEQNTNDWIDNVNRNYGIQINSFGNQSSNISYEQSQSVNSKTKGLINIIHKELNEPSSRPSISMKHIAIQCLFNDFKTNPSDVILTGHVSTSSTKPIITSLKPLLPGFNECGIQVDFNDNSDIDLLFEIYSNRLSSETIRHFYEVCQNDIQRTCSQIDEYLQYNDSKGVPIGTLRQLCLNTLNQWNEQTKSIDPLFDTKSVDDLLQDINDDEILEDLTLSNAQSNVESLDTEQITIPWTVINSLEELYGEISDKSFVSSNNNGVSLPFDDDLSVSIYQALQRFLIQSNQTMKPVIENPVKKENKKTKNNNNNNNPKRTLSSENQSNSDNHKNRVPSLKQIINEEHQAAKAQQSKQKHQLDYATEHKFKELHRHFPSFDTDLLYDIFRENEYNYDITLVCISTMLDEHASITTTQPSQLVRSSRSIPTTNTTMEPVVESYELLRHDALRHAQQRKEFYVKAHQANRHGMSGVASFYIHRASEETQLMKDANRAACERLSQWRLVEYKRTHCLDLHGLHSDEALNLFKQIEQDFKEGNRRTTPKSIEIITGYGKNSVYGGSHGKIRSVILTYLQQRHYKYSEPNKGVILLQVTNIRN